MELDIRELSIIKNELALKAINDGEVAKLREKINDEIEILEKKNKDKSCGYCSGSWD